MKKLALVVLGALAMMSCSKDDEAVQSQSSVVVPKTSANKLSTGVNVKLHKAFTAYSQAYGMTSMQREFLVEVRNLAYNKNVDVLHKMPNGTWQFFPMTYVKSTPDNTEIWSYTYAGNNLNYFGQEFVFRYIVNGVEYWDNNNGQNYTMGNLSGVLLGSNVNVLNAGGFVNKGKFDVMANIQNLAYTKEVKVVYTTDSWATSSTAPLSYKTSQTVGRSQSVLSPNQFGVEFWASFSEITVPSSVQELQYAIVYKVNGVEYWDNNFGQNYKATIY